jgi:hypothetical protein
VRQLAWLNAIPEGSKSSRLKSLREADENSSFLKLPNIDGAEYLVGLLYEAGLAGSNGMGIVSLTWTEINNWMAATDLNLSTWEILTIKTLSDAYVGEYSQASSKTRLAPFSQEDDNVVASRAKVADRLRNALRSFGKPSVTGTK